MLRLMVVFFGLLLSACEPPAVKVTDLDSFNEQNKRDGLVHGNLKLLPPSQESNAKITLTPHSVTLTKSHVLGIQPELYQPKFRLEGIISPMKQTDVLLPQTASLQSVHVRIGDSVKQGDELVLFYHITLLNDNRKLSTDDDTPKPPQTSFAFRQTPVIITAPHAGQIQVIYPQHRGQVYEQNSPVLTISDDSQLKFISLLPHNFQEHLSVGNAVKFSTADGKNFSGQIEKISPDPLITAMLNVHVHIKPSEIQKANLKRDETVSGYVEYGQKTVGVLVPAFAIFDEQLRPMDLSELQHPPFRPATPIKAWIWVIKQDERLHLTPIDLIEYRPQSDLYLVHGVSLTGLVVLADLPKSVQGKKVRLK